MDAVDRSRHRPGRVVFALLSLVALTGALYGRTLDYDFVIDDQHYILTNPAVVHGASFGAYFSDPRTVSSSELFQYASWRPLRTLAFRALFRVAGPRPAPWRATNLSLYALAGTLLFAVLRRLTRSDRAALVAALAWTAAPVHVEPAIYLSSIGDHLSLVLQLAALLAGLRAASATRPVAWGVASVALGALALGVKEMAATTVLLLPLLIAAQQGAGALRTRRTLALLAAHAAITLSFVATRAALLGALGHHPITAGRLWEGIFAAPALVIDYARISLALFDHAPAYSDPPYPSVAEALGTTAALAAAIGLAVLARRKAVWLGIAWFPIALLPVLHIIPISATYADRYALVPSVGIALAFAGILDAVPPPFRRVSWIGTALLTVVLGAASWLQQPMWHDGIALWRSGVALEPKCALAHINLGTVLLRAGHLDEAERELSRGAALGHLMPGVEVQRAMALDALGRTDEAISLLDRDRRRFEPFGRGHALLGSLLLRRGDVAAARGHLAAARADAASDPMTMLLLAQLAERDGRPAAAAAIFFDLAKGSPDNPRLHYFAARSALAAGDPGRAIDAARACLAAAPDQAQCSCVMGRALISAGRTDQARPALTRALAALPDGEERRLCAAAIESLR